MNNHSTREEQIFEQALKCASDAERSAFLNDACHNSPELRARLELMLEGHFRAEKFLDDRPNSMSPSPDEAIGSSIGRYKLLEKIGEGGFGIVYAAEQKEPVKRRVALKIIKLGMDTKQVVARFEAERQALALMDHPNIAKVHDGGATDGGRPYFVMELVQGVPITEFCDKNKLPANERLKLFVQVCQAIQHAHQKGIIHRDIKPTNVLVTLHDGVPVPKVIDFGVAKATSQELTEKTLFTNFGMMIGTPAYMSPEQAEMSGLDVDTRTDIYALGVLLYQLLTGTTPFPEKRLRSLGYGEMQRVIVNEDPERPSTRLSTMGDEERTILIRNCGDEMASLSKLLSGDLDWVVMKCLEKDRARRYETANALAAEINACLNNEPVTARPPSFAYRTGKIVRRHKFRFAAAATILVILILSSFISTWQAVKARRAEHAAREQAETAKTVKDFLVRELVGRADSWMFQVYDPTNRIIVERVAQAVEGKFTNQPIVEAEVRYALGEAFSGMGDYTRAAAQHERVYALRTLSLGVAHSDTLVAAAAVAFDWHSLGRDREAFPLLDENIAAARAAAPELSYGAAEVLCVRAYNFIRLQRLEEAIPDLREAREILERSGAQGSTKLTEVLFYLADIPRKQGQFSEAESLHEEVLSRSRRVHGTNHPWVGIVLKSQGLLLNVQKRWGEAEIKLLEASSVLGGSLGPDSELTLESEGFLARALEGQGRVEEAAARFSSLHKRWQRYLPQDNARYKVHSIAEFSVRQRRYEQARSAFADLEQAFVAIPPEYPTQFEVFLRATAATRGWPAAAEVCRKHFDDFPDSLMTWLRKAWIFRHVGDEESYQRVVVKVLALPPSTTTTNDQHMPIEIAALGSFPFAVEQVKQLDSMMNALETALPTYPTNQQIWGYRAMAQMQLRLGRFDKCLVELDRSKAKLTDPDPYALFIKAQCLYRFGRVEEARVALEEAETASKAQLPELLGQSENFLTLEQLYQHLVMRRETRALITGDQATP